MDTSNTTAVVRTQNLHLVYQTLLERGMMTKQEVVQLLKMSLPTVTQDLRQLDELGLLKSEKRTNSGGGRNAMMYGIDPNGRVAVGAYLTGHHITCVAVNIRGVLIAERRDRVEFDLASDAYRRRLGANVEAILSENGLDPARVLGVGVALPGIVSADGETVCHGETHNFTGMTRAEICRYIPYPGRIFHDSAAAGFAEVWHNPSVRNAVYVNLNEHIGGALIIDRRVYEGTHGRCGEIGHIVLDPASKKRCYCGSVGCFDTVCAGKALEDFSGESVDAYFERLQSSDARYTEHWHDYLQNLARAIHTVRMLFDCEIILGGAVGARLSAYIPELAAMVDAGNAFEQDAIDYILPCRFRVEASAAGSAIMLVDAFAHHVTG